MALESDGAGSQSLLLPNNKTLSVFSGFLTSKCGRDYSLRLSMPLRHEGELGERARMHAAKLEVDWKLEYMLRAHKSKVQQYLKESTSVAGFLRELKNLVNQLEVVESSTSQPLPHAFYQQIIADIAHIGWDHVIETSPDMTSLKLAVSDKEERRHILSVHINPSLYPKKLARVSAETPLPFVPKWSSTGRLCDLLTQFKQWTNQFHAFWSVMEEMDSSLWVLEPLKPTRSCNFRRVVVDSSMSLTMYLEIDCLHANTQPPQCSFMGPDSDVTLLKESYVKGRSKWNCEVSVLGNLQQILGVDFPQKPAQFEEQDTIECPVCYQGNEGGDVPDVRCDNCSKYYHKACIIEWFKSSATSVYTTFHSFSGECPYCSKRMVVKP